jgi:hypothetical protein
MKPRLFIASSVEGLSIAYAIQSNLHHCADAAVWDQGIFLPSRYTLDAIIDAISISDFAVFVFAADDQTTIRGESNRTVRDNVLMELGLAIGKLGRENTFFVMPEDVDLHIPTDLLGVTPLKYRSQTDAARVQASLGHACNQIRNAVAGSATRNRKFKVPTNDSAAIGDYMHKWIERGGRVAIFSRDLSWARSPELLELLTRKAAARELIICVPEPLDISDSLPGAEIFVYSGLRYVPQSRFTFVHFGRGGARVAVGLPQGSHHIIEEFDANNPAFYMAADLVEFAIKAAKESLK